MADLKITNHRLHTIVVASVALHLGMQGEEGEGASSTAHRYIFNITEPRTPFDRWSERALLLPHQLEDLAEAARQAAAWFADYESFKLQQ